MIADDGVMGLVSRKCCQRDNGGYIYSIYRLSHKKGDLNLELKEKRKTLVKKMPSKFYIIYS